MERYVILHNLRSAHNVGAIFRTADASAITHIYLTGYTPAPLDRFKRPQGEIAKTALGAEKTIPWTSARSLSRVMQTLRSKGVRVIGVEQDASARDYRLFKPEGGTAFLFGNEVTGLAPSTRSACDDLIEIPMLGMKESLNVATTAGIILFSTLPFN
jgi:23S rRNA (guanosine2251-2'-O)-methyltransferase